ncbi:cGMP-dependent 3',5'-cyclic phosphodiesterase [Platysternon megacephalum]|uniref:cGMP-dependent 3',5'-cyclic phosphodiesterase n=1 Tax=Platysternon megacephalum TaxID=55544 RepID=A0A4D9E190_9SAUR|nr:cGMP-dependent 3',5'-cyclic phosphodiesterase [Platysternon megacephalum]
MGAWLPGGLWDLSQCHFRNDPEPNSRDQAGGSDFGYCGSAPVSAKQLENEARRRAWNCFQHDDVWALSCRAGQGCSQQEVRPRRSLAFERLRVLEQGTPNPYTLQPQLEC